MGVKNTLLSCPRLAIWEKQEPQPPGRGPRKALRPSRQSASQTASPRRPRAQGTGRGQGRGVPGTRVLVRGLDRAMPISVIP